jgi:hypothetical protein
MAYTTYNSVQPVSGSSTSAAAPTNAFYMGANAQLTLPASTLNTLTGIMSDKFGRIITIPQGPRDMVGVLGSTAGYNANANQSTQIRLTTSAVAVTAAPAGYYFDITSVVFCNSSNNPTTVTLTDGTNTYYFAVPPGDIRGANYSVPLKASGTTTAWSATTLTSIDSLWVTVQYIKNS